MKKESWLIASLGGLIVLCAFFLFVIWRPILTHQKTGEVQNTTAKTDQKTTGKEEVKSPESGMTIVDLMQDAEMPKGLEFKPFFEKEEQKIKETFLARFSALIDRQILAEIKPESDSNPLSEAGSVRQVFSQNTPTETPKRVLTDEEWFKIAYPDYYLEYLRLMQNLMVERGFLAASEKVEFKEAKDINPFLYKVIDFALKENIYDRQQAANARYGIDVVLPMLQKGERIQWSKALSVLILEALKTKTAWAQTGTDCYRQGASTGTGFNGFAVCCNCGWGYWYETIIYFNDCGVLSSVTCNLYEMGCKNSVCAFPKPMIWDPTTMICGCG